MHLNKLLYNLIITSVIFVCDILFISMCYIIILHDTLSKFIPFYILKCGEILKMSNNKMFGYWNN